MSGTGGVSTSMDLLGTRECQKSGGIFGSCKSNSDRILFLPLPVHKAHYIATKHMLNRYKVIDRSRLDFGSIRCAHQRKSRDEAFLCERILMRQTEQSESYFTRLFFLSR